MDNVCEIFHCHNFENDEKFQQGWNSLCKLKQKDNKPPNDEEELQAKLFYFSRHYQHISLGAYRDWLHSSEFSLSKPTESNVSQNFRPPEKHLVDNLLDSQTIKFDSIPIPSTGTIVIEEGICSSIRHLELDSAAKPLHDADIPEAATNKLDDDWENTNNSTRQDYQAAEDLDNTEMNLSFATIMSFVEQGKPIPGIKKLNIEPTHGLATKSVASKIKKPWDK